MSTQKIFDFSTLSFWGSCLGVMISLGIEFFEIALDTDLFANTAEFDPFLHIIAHIGIGGLVGAILFTAGAWALNRNVKPGRTSLD